MGTTALWPKDLFMWISQNINLDPWLDLCPGTLYLKFRIVLKVKEYERDVPNIICEKNVVTGQTKSLIIMKIYSNKLFHYKIKITTRLRKVGTVWTPYFTMLLFRPRYAEAELWIVSSTLKEPP